MGVVFNVARAGYRAALAVSAPFARAQSRKRLKGIQHISDGDTSRLIRVAFIVFESSTWDKQEPVYRECLKRPDFEAKVIVVPNNGALSSSHNYGPEKDFFEAEVDDPIFAFDEKGAWNPRALEHFDYVFYEDSYIYHYPKKLRPSAMSKHSVTCYIPYGIFGSNVFREVAAAEAFYRNIAIAFADSDKEKESLENKLKGSVQQGIQHIESLGYPALECYTGAEEPQRPCRMMWTPRWSYDKEIGGSHFFEYKEAINSLAKDLDGLCGVTVRPHPMMFDEFITKGMMSEKDRDDYCAELDELGIVLDSNRSVTQALLATDILVTDFSSIILMYFLTGRPIVYCPCSIEFNELFQSIEPGMYIVYNEDELKRIVSQLAQGIDPLQELRKDIIAKHFSKIDGSSKRIVDYLKTDFIRRRQIS